MKWKFSWMQIVRLIVMVIAVAAVIYAIEYLPQTPLMWASVGLIIVGFMMMLFVFRSVQRRRMERGVEPKRKKR